MNAIRCPTLLIAVGVALSCARLVVGGGAPGAAPAPAADAQANQAVDDALHALRRMAHSHPNPYIRELLPDLLEPRNPPLEPQRRQAWNLGHWTIDPFDRTFTVRLDDPRKQVLKGLVAPDTEGWWMATFLDEQAVSRDWIPPADAQLTPEQARSALLGMCARKGEDANVAQAAPVLSEADPQALASGTIESRKGVGYPRTWTIDFKEHYFWLSIGPADRQWTYEGTFGWNKDRKWDAWITSAWLSSAQE